MEEHADRKHSDDELTIGGTDPPTGSATSGGAAASAARARSTSDASAVTSMGVNVAAILQPGTVLGQRYEIVEMLGLGGMGAVYKAKDHELDRTIALKVIRPDLANNAEALGRFKQELLTAREVSHHNVVRIFDIGEADGIKFITMEYVVGQDLRALLAERTKLSAGEAMEIIRQVCAGLGAAHRQGIIHRDLKPGNIMRDQHGRIVVMDFGLARSLEDVTTHMTQTGAMVGTVAYMSPEQALAQKLDARSDLFTIGLIFYELLTGKQPYEADSSLASLIKRTRETAIPAVEVDPTIPQAVSNIVAKCLERDLGQRFQTADQIIELIDEVQGRKPLSSTIIAAPPATTKKRWVVMAAAAFVIIAVTIAATLFLKSRGVPPQASKTVKVIVADFENATSEDVFDGTLEPAFALALEGASFISTYGRQQARREIGQIKPGAVLDGSNAQLLAVRDGIDVVIAGSVRRQADRYTLAIRALDVATSKVISDQSLDAKDKDGILKALGSLASQVRRDLGDVSSNLKAGAQEETYTSTSLEAAHEYAKAQDLRYAGKSEDAIRGFMKAIELDPKFGTAYAGLAAMYANLGRREDATKYYKVAMENADRMTERERYRTRGGYYLATMDAPHAIEEFTALTKAYPADNMGHSALAFAHYLRQDMARAIEEGRRALEIYPKNVPYRNNVALYLLYAGDFANAEKEASAALAANPAYMKAYTTKALAQIGQENRAGAKTTYGALEQISPAGASFAAAGLADIALYEGRYADAADIVTKAIAADLKESNSAAAAKKLVLLAEAQSAIGQKATAAKTVEQALTTDRASVLFSSARLLVELGQYAKAAALAEELAARVEPVRQAQSKLIAAEISIEKQKYGEAVQLLQGAIGNSDLWLARYDLARAYAHIGSNALPQADGELERCVKRQGEASDVLMNEMPTFHYFPSVYYYYGLVRAGQGSASGANDMFKKFLSLRSHAENDPLVKDARKRVQQ